ncbi:hypothetical protein [Streptomyces sp. NPDC086182]
MADQPDEGGGASAVVAGQHELGGSQCVLTGARDDAGRHALS